MERIYDILGYDNIKIFQDDEFFSFSLDSIMLANFVSIKLRDKNIADLCSGNGIISLILSLRTSSKIVGIEIQEKLAKLAQKSVNYNKLNNQIEIVNEDIKNYSINNCEKFDVVTCNPPFFKIHEKNFFNFSEEKAIARHEIAINLKETLLVSKKILKNNGTFAIVHRPERLLELLEQFRNNNIEPKRLQFVYSRLDKEAIMVLLEGVKNGKSGLKVEPPFVLYNNDNTITEQYDLLIKEVVK